MKKIWSNKTEPSVILDAKLPLLQKKKYKRPVFIQLLLIVFL